MEGKKVLIGCERSGTVREAFRRSGILTMSNDIVPADDGSKYHLEMDVFEAIKWDDWDLIILHPPCTALAVSGNKHYGVGKPKYEERLRSSEWTYKLWEEALRVSPRVCLENPVGVLRSLQKGFPKPQYINPWMFGESASKKTALFLHNLPELQPTNVVDKGEYHITKSGRRLPKWYNLPPSEDRAKIRSKTFQGIADAMAEQWGSL